MIFITYQGIISCVKSFLKRQNITIDTIIYEETTKAQEIIMKAPKGCKTFYKVFLDKKITANALQSWEKIFEKELEWERIFKKVKKIKEVKLKWFQMRICYRILVTNSVLKEMKVVNDNLCNFCVTEKDTIVHYLWECRYVQAFWVALEKMLLEKTNQFHDFKVNKFLALFGTY